MKKVHLSDIRLIIFITFLFSPLARAQGKWEFAGKVKYPQTKEAIVLSRFDFNSNRYKKIKEIKTDKAGNFKQSFAFKIPGLYWANFYGKQYAFFVTDNASQRIGLTIDGNRKKGDFRFEGSKATQLLYQFWQAKKDKEATLKKLEKQASKGISHPLAAQYKQVHARFAANAQQLVAKMGSSIAAIVVLFDLDIHQYLPTFEQVAQVQQKNHPELLTTKQLISRVQKAKKLTPGATAPEITQGNFKLSALRGKYVLLDFWASWCKPCRVENMHYKKVYQRLKTRNFEIVGVSIDQSKKMWKKALKQDLLPWVQLRLPKGRKSLVAQTYMVGSIPLNFLLDKEGKIVGKNVSAQALEKLVRQE